MDNTQQRRLQELDHSDFEIVKGEPDIRGWDVRNASRQKLGEVEELIVDAEKRKVRYMVVDLDDNELKLDHRKVLLPIGLAELDEKDDDVLIPSVTAEHIAALPDYNRDTLDEAVERQVCSTLGRRIDQPAATTETPNTLMSEGTTERKRHAKIIEHDDSFYNHQYFQDDNLYKHRPEKMQPTKQRPDEATSDYERGLRLWELRSEDGATIGETEQKERDGKGEQHEQRRLELVRNRRRDYEDRRGYTHRDRDSESSSDNNQQRHHRGSTIIDRIRDEGMQDG